MSLRPLRSAVESWSPARGIAADPLQRIAAAWSAIVGRNVAAHCTPLALNGATLLIATRSSAWSQQLHLLSPTILGAIATLPEAAEVRRLAFRSGAMTRAASRAAGRPPLPPDTPARRRRAESGAPAADVPDDAAGALVRLRARIARERAHGGAACADCGARFAEPEAPRLCAPCTGKRDAERAVTIARLVYMAPWLGLAELREHLPDLSGAEFERSRRMLLQRWWLMLERARRARTLSGSGIERHVASSYVLLESRLPPDRITPAVVKNLLGPDLAKLLWPVHDDVPQSSKNDVR